MMQNVHPRCRCSRNNKLGPPTYPWAAVVAPLPTAARVPAFLMELSCNISSSRICCGKGLRAVLRRDSIFFILLKYVYINRIVGMYAFSCAHQRRMFSCAS